MFRSAILLGAAVMSNVAVGLLMKHSSRSTSRSARISFLGGLLLLAVNLLCYRQSLARIDLSIAYPIFAATSLILICGAAGWLFGENVSSRQILGVAVILCGMALVCAK